MFSMQMELESIYKDTLEYVGQLKERIYSLVRSKIDEFENELMIEIKRETDLLLQIYGLWNVKESYDLFKEEIKNKINLFKNIESQWEVTTLSGKMSIVDPQLLIDQKKRQINTQDKVQEKRTKQINKFISEDYQCPICHQNIQSSFTARSHLKYLHQIPKGLFCPHCDILFNRTSILAEHLVLKHSNASDLKYRCVYTGKWFSSKKELQTNIIQQVGYLVPLSKIKYKIKEESISDDQQKDSSMLDQDNPQLLVKQQHKIIYKNKPQVRKFEQSSLLPNNSTLFDYLCPICQVKLNSSYAARVHLKFFHCIPKALSCPHCDFLDNNARAFAQHIATKHFEQSDTTTMNTYDCQFTGKSFRNQREFSKHVAQEKGYLITPSHLNHRLRQ